MPLVIDTEASHCDVCLENYEAGTDITPVVLACGHALCKPCSQSLGASCHLCRSWFNRDRITKLHVDFGREHAATGPAAEVAKDMEARAADVSKLQDIPAVRQEIEIVMDWLGHQTEDKYILLRAYCDLVLKLCTTMESKMSYKERYRNADGKLRDLKEDSEARVRDLSDRLSALEKELSIYRKDYDNDLEEDFISTRNANPLPQPPQPVFFGTPPLDPLDADYIEYTMNGKPMSRSASTKGKAMEVQPHKSSRSPTRRDTTASRRHHQNHSGSSSRQRSESEVPQGNSRPSQRRSYEHARNLEPDDHSSRHRRPSSRREQPYDALGQDPQRLFPRSQSQDNIAENSYGAYTRPKPRSSSYGQNGATHPTTPRRASHESTSQRRDSTRGANQYVSSIRFPGSHVDGIDGMPSESLPTSQRPKKLSNASVNSTTGHRTLAHQSSTVTARPIPQTVLHPVNTHTYARVPSNEQLGPRSRKSSLQRYATPPSASYSGNGHTATGGSYPYPSTPVVGSQTAHSPYTTGFTMAPGPNQWTATQSKPLPPKPIVGVDSSYVPFPDSHVPASNSGYGAGPSSQSRTYTPEGTSVAHGSYGHGAAVNASRIVDPSAIPQENITIQGTAPIHSQNPTSSRSSHHPTLHGRRSMSGSQNSPTAAYPITSHSHSQPTITGASSSYRQPDTIVYLRNDSALSDSATAAASTRTPRLRRTSGTKVLSGPGRPTTPSASIHPNMVDSGDLA